MTASSSRLHRPLAALLAVILVASGAPTTRATAGTVVADSGSGNGIASGRVVRADPDNARVTVTNGFHFWAALDVSYVGGSNFLHPTDPRVDFGGIYAGGGLIGPGGTAAWDGRFSAPSQALVRVHYDLSSAGGAAALAANLLTIIADSLGASLSASSPGRLLTALKVVTDLSTWADFVRQAQTNDIWGLVTSVELLLGSKTGRDTLRYALAQLGVLATDADLLKAASVAGIIDWAWTLFDIYRAVLLGQNDGTVIFSVAPPVVTPGPTATPTARPTPAATPRPTSAPTPVPTPGIPTARIGPWLVSPVSRSRSLTGPRGGDFSEPQLPAGYARLRLVISVTNVTSEPQEITSGVISLRPSFQAVARSDDGYRYGIAGSPGGWPALSGGGVVPPGFGIPLTLITDVPADVTVADIEVSLIRDDDNCQADTCVAAFSLGGFKKSGHARLIVPTSSFLSLGQSLTQGPLTITPTSRWQFIEPCSEGVAGPWELAIPIKLGSSFGYALRFDGSIGVLDPTGRVYPGRIQIVTSGGISPGADVPPRGEVIATALADAAPWEDTCSGEPRPVAGRWYLFINMAALMDRTGGTGELAGPAWGVWSLGKIAP